MRKLLVVVLLPALLIMNGCTGTSRSNVKKYPVVKTADVQPDEEKKLVEPAVQPDAVGQADSVETAVNEVEAKPVEKLEAMSSREIQIALKNAGYYDGEIDGVLGSRSRDAIRRFQQDNGLIDDSVAGTKTQEKLRKYINTEGKL